MALDFGKAVGPLPLGAWFAVVGVGLGVSLYTKSQSDSGPPLIVEDTGSVPGVGTGAVGGWQYQPAAIPVGVEETKIETNEAWARQCINWLIAQGYDAGVADLAIRKYTGAENLSVQEYALVRLALNKFGSPPIPLPAGDIVIPSIPKPPTQVPGPVTQVPQPPILVTAPPPPVRRTYTVVRGDSLWKISARYYGSGLKWPVIYAANISVVGGNPNLIKPGQVLTIP